MKTKIVYISGNEIFDVRDIRAAFEEVRNALNLDKDTVLFGVPVDNQDAGLMPQTDNHETITPIVHQETTPEITESEIENESQPEVIEEKPKRSRKKSTTKPDIEPIVEVISETTEIVDVSHDTPEPTPDDDNEKVVPILSVLGTQDETPDEQNNNTETIDTIPEISDDLPEQVIESQETEIADDDDTSLEKLLSEMTPLQEDIMADKVVSEPVIEPETEDDISVDTTLEKLANEFVENRDKIAAETKSSSRSKIGKLRNILPFKQSKHKDTGLGDLFGWAGVAANDEEFSVPGFFTNSASKK